MNNIEITRNFRRSITKVILAIGLFFISYLILIALSLGLLTACGYAALFIVSSKITFITVAAGVGLISFGIMFFIFLIKFIFSKHTDKNPYRVQIYQEEHPELFKLIKEVSDSVGTQYPKKVFLRHDVNASVFYDSSFRSLFFPVKKNLDIGLGLINSVNQAELKAVLAHEFGHFSQRSMKLGSYVYTVNNVIYNLVYNYDEWDRTIQKWANTGGVFGFFALLTFKLAELTRFALRKSYDLINLPYMNLSREMEFHADTIAASIAGKENMISALRRIEFCDVAFNQTITNLDALAANQKQSRNIYLNHRHEIRMLSGYFSLETENHLPLILDKDLNVNIVRPRVIFKDQWASHPSREEREKRISNVTELIPRPLLKNDSWSVLNNYQMIQEKLTANLYSVNYDDLSSFKAIGNDEYIKYNASKHAQYKIDDFYKGFYSNRFLLNIDPENVFGCKPEGNIQELLTDIYNKQTKLKFARLECGNNDLLTLNQIKSKDIKTRYFEFDNKQYHRRDAGKVIHILENEMNLLKDEVKKIEEKAVGINIAIANLVSAEAKELLLDLYKKLLSNQSISEKHQEFMHLIAGYQYTVYNKPRWQDDELTQFNRELSKFEQNYKNYMKGLNRDRYENIFSKHKEPLDTYLNGDTSYVRVASFDIEGFNALVGLVLENHNVITESVLGALKRLTDVQLNNYNRLEITVASLA
jgi:Zn-dependent protease with chaperone function